MVDLSRYKFRITREGLWCMVPTMTLAVFLLVITSLGPWLNVRFGTGFGSIREYPEIWYGIGGFVFLSVYGCWRAGWRDGPPDGPQLDDTDAADLSPPVAGEDDKQVRRRRPGRRPGNHAMVR